MDVEQVRTAAGELIPVWRCGGCGACHSPGTRSEFGKEMTARAAERCCTCRTCGAVVGWRRYQCDACRAEDDARAAAYHAERAALPPPPPLRVRWPGNELDGLVVPDRDGDSDADDLLAELESRGLTLTREAT